ncbi:hypothetical protein IQ260_19600, partial [Leptolyngbya cf. ectocarpi LEGE 11479]
MKILEDPLPENLLGIRICTIFPYRWRSIERPTQGGDWSTNPYPLRPRSLWQRWKSAETVVGVRFGTNTTYGLIDIDAGSDYHSEQGLEDIKAALETIGIVRTVLIRSSWSGGWHLYCPLADPVSTFGLACAFQHAFEAQGLSVCPGQLETFPNIKAYARPWEITEYNGHRLPLQPGTGSCMIDHNLQPTSGNLERFLWAWDCAAKLQDADALSVAITQGREAQSKRKQRRYGKVDQWRDDLRLEIESGWTGPGQTNALLRAIATYGRVFEGLADDELAIYIEQMAYARPGYLEYCNHQPQIPKKSKAWSRWATRFYWPLGTPPQRDSSVTSSINDERRDDARRRIQQAVNRLAQLGELAGTVSHRLAQLCKLAQTSAQTLYKNLDLWHPDRWCVIPQPEAVSPIKETCNELQGDLLKPLPDGPLHTLPPLLRCRAVTNPPKNLLPRGGEGVI